MRPYRLVIPVAVSLINGCSSSTEIMSRWGDGDITPDSLVYFENHRVALGIQNDQEYLYLLLTVGDRQQQRLIAFRGLTVWFDYTGGDERRLGIHYPIGAGFPPAGEMRGRRPFPDQRPMMDTSWTFPQNFPDELDIYGPMEGEHERLRMSETKGIEVHIMAQDGSLRYAMKVPLMDSGPHLYGIGARPGTLVGVGVNTGGFFGQHEGGGPMPGGGNGERPGGGMGRPPGGTQGAPPGRMREQVKPLDLWFTVRLAGGPQ